MKTYKTLPALCALAALSIPGVAYADAVASIGSVADAAQDATADKGVSKQEKTAYDLQRLELKHRLKDSGRLFFETNFVVKDLDGADELRNARVEAVLKVTGDTTRSVTVVGNLKGDEKYTVDGKEVLCDGLVFSVHPNVNTLRLTMPDACIPQGENIAAEGSVVIATGNGKIRDTAAFTSPGDRSDARFKSASRNDEQGDVEYVVDPSQNQNIATSGDVSRVRTSASAQKLTSYATVVDLATRAYDPKQKFTFTYLNAGKELLVLKAEADPAKREQQLVLTAPQGCSATALFQAKTNTVVVTTARDCFEKAAVEVKVTSEVFDSEGDLAGSDVTVPTRLTYLD